MAESQLCERTCVKRKEKHCGPGRKRKTPSICQNYWIVSDHVLFSVPPFCLFKTYGKLWNNPTVDVKLTHDLTKFFHIQTTSRQNFPYISHHIPHIFLPLYTETQGHRKQGEGSWWEDLLVKIFNDQEWIKGDNKCFGIYGVHNPLSLSHTSIAWLVFISCFPAQWGEMV